MWFSFNTDYLHYPTSTSFLRSRSSKRNRYWPT